MTFINGGFPPINYCPQEDQIKNNINKSRLFSSNIKSNINIIELLSDSKKKPLINISNEIDIEEVNDID
jgi:hypothetical protein